MFYGGQGSYARPPSGGYAPQRVAPTAIEKDYPLTFCFYSYDGSKGFNLMNCGTSTFSGKFTHCETYDGRSQLSAFISSSSPVFSEAIRTYSTADYTFITVYLTRLQWERYRLVVQKHKDTTRFATCAVYFHLCVCCCCCTSDTSRTCSDIVAEMIAAIWPEHPLFRPTREYDPNDVYKLVVDLTTNKSVPYIENSKNPSPRE